MHTLFILPSLEQNLLGLPAIRDLHDLQKVDSLGEPPQAKFPSLFTGLGELKGDPYKMQLKSDATPFPLNTARNVPLPLREKVQAELQRMQALDVIASVEEPTPWCSGMVVVPKVSGQVHICVDYQHLASAVLLSTFNGR